MKDINQWYADKCDDITVETFPFGDDYISYKGNLIDWWSIQDPRCLIIVCKQFGIDIIAGDVDKAIKELEVIYEAEKDE